MPLKNSATPLSPNVHFSRSATGSEGLWKLDHITVSQSYEIKSQSYEIKYQNVGILSQN